MSVKIKNYSIVFLLTLALGGCNTNCSDFGSNIFLRTGNDEVIGKEKFFEFELFCGNDTINSYWLFKRDTLFCGVVTGVDCKKCFPFFTCNLSIDSSYFFNDYFNSHCKGNTLSSSMVEVSNLKVLTNQPKSSKTYIFSQKVWEPGQGGHNVVEIRILAFNSKFGFLDYHVIPAKRKLDSYFPF